VCLNISSGLTFLLGPQSRLWFGRVLRAVLWGRCLTLAGTLPADEPAMRVSLEF
jgi:hypothetical protein